MSSLLARRTGMPVFAAIAAAYSCSALLRAIAVTLSPALSWELSLQSRSFVFFEGGGSGLPWRFRRAAGHSKVDRRICGRRFVAVGQFSARYGRVPGLLDRVVWLHAAGTCCDS